MPTRRRQWEQRKRTVTQSEQPGDALPDVVLIVTAAARKPKSRSSWRPKGFRPRTGGLRVSVQPGGCSGFKYSLLIEDQSAEDDFIVDQGRGFRMFVDPFSAQYLQGITIDHVSSMQGSGFTFKNPNATGGCGCGSSFSGLRATVPFAFSAAA